MKNNKDFEKGKDTKDAGIEQETSKGRNNGKKGNGKRNKGNGNKPLKKVGNINDVSYYYTDPNVLASVTNFSFTEFQGIPVHLGDAHYSGYTKPYVMDENVANVVAIRMNPSIQPTAAEGSTGTEAINVVALRNYTNLTAGNGKTSNYAYADPMMAVMAIGSAVSMYSHIKRAFNSYQLVNQRNREYPRLLFTAMGIDWDDFKRNIANYRDQFNLTVCQFDKIPIFNNIAYLDKCKHMYENIYVDEQSPLAQTYMFVPYSVWVLDEAYDPSGSGLVTTPLYDTKGDTSVKTMAELLEIFDEQIRALTTSTTLNLVYSDILRLMSNGRGTSFILETIPLMPDPKFGPIINDEIRHWINNMQIVGTPIDKDALPSAVTHGSTNSNDVACDGSTGGILYHPTFVFDEFTDDTYAQTRYEAVHAWWDTNLINFDSMDPSIEDKVNATRLAVRANVLPIVEGDKRKTYAQDIDLGDFYCVYVIGWSDTNNNTLRLANNYLNITGVALTDVSNLTAYARLCDNLSKLKYAPRLALTDWSNLGPEGNNLLKAIEGDLCYYTTIPHSLTKRMKDAEMFGLFDFKLS